MRRILMEVHGELMELEQRIAAMNQDIDAIAARSDTARCLMTVSDIGPPALTNLLAAAGFGLQFGKARDLTASLDLVPREHSIGRKTTLHGNSMSRVARIYGVAPAGSKRRPDRYPCWR